MSKPELYVLHVIGKMDIGGAESMLMNLYRNIDRSKVQFDFVEHFEERAAFDEEIESMGGTIYRCPRYMGRNHLEYVRWWKAFFKEHKNKYKIVHGHIGSTASIYLKIAKKNGLCTIAHSHNAMKGISIRNFLYKSYSYSTRYIADYFFGCSKAALESRYGKKTANNAIKSFVLSNAIDSTRFRYNEKVRERVRKENKWDNKIVIGHVGRFDPIKNHAFLLQVFKAFYENNKESLLVLVGDGTDRSNIEKAIKEMHLTQAVTLLGLRKDVPDLLQGIDIIILPSISEGLPVSIIEAQAAGLPCICSTAVTDEVDITGNCRFLQIDQTEKWVEEITQMLQVPRKDTHKQIVESGYDIKTTCEWLLNKYVEIAER